MEPQNQKISTWCFILGRETLLSAAELKAVFEMENIAIERMTSNKNLFVETHNKIDAVKMINQLGGTIKICEKIECGNSKLEIGNFLCSHIADGKIIFSVSGDIDNKFGLEIKKLVKNLGRSVRFVEPKNTATIIHNHLVEKGADLNILPEGVFLTRAIQPIESFGKRDFGRPGRDDLSGMLPPKLAMIMVNLARVPREAVILDPFCGSGTILTEAMLLGYGNLIGTDSSEKAIEDTKKNMAWMKQNFQFSIFNFSPYGRSPVGRKSNLNFQFYKLDATKLNEKLRPESVDCIITEPYLGKPLNGKESLEELNSQARELKNLYLSAFKQFSKILKKDGAIVFIIPRFKLRDQWVAVNCRKEIENLGFAVEKMWDQHEFLLYHRPQQFVGREIWKFIKQSSS